MRTVELVFLRLPLGTPMWERAIATYSLEATSVDGIDLMLLTWRPVHSLSAKSVLDASTAHLYILISSNQFKSSNILRHDLDSQLQCHDKFSSVFQPELECHAINEQ